MTKIDIDRFICDFLKCIGDHYIFEEEKFIHYALKQQGLEYKSGEIVEIDQPPLTEELKAKFNVGDWIVDYLGNTLQIIDVYPSYYRVKEYNQRNNQRIYNWDSKSAESSSHLWTIKDAKPGDVLINEFHLIFILKEIRNNTFISYCSVIERGIDSIINSIAEREVGDVSLVKVMPVTKEQRDILFKAIEKEGYKWNQEELRLEKIDKPDIAYANGVILSEDEQGIDRSSCTFTKENNKPQTIKFKTKDESIYQDKSPLFQDSFDNLRVKSIDLDKVDIDKMVEKYRDYVNLAGSSHSNELRIIGYKRGLKDMLKVIKEGGKQ